MKTLSLLKTEFSMHRHTLLRYISPERQVMGQKLILIPASVFDFFTTIE
jgi:hypothetical protein